MKRTGRLLKINLLASVLIFAMSCSVKKKNLNLVEKNCFSLETKNDELKILRKEETLLREVCTNNDVSFCSDGYAQVYRVSPFLLDYRNTNNLNSLYKNNAIYITDQSVLSTKFKEMNQIEKMEIVESKISQLFSSENVVYESEFLRNAYKRQNKELKIKKVFEGKFFLEMVSLDFEYVYLGKKCVYIPQMEQDTGNKERKIESVLVDFYCIVNIFNE